MAPLGLPQRSARSYFTFRLCVGVEVLQYRVDRQSRFIQGWCQRGVCVSVCVSVYAVQEEEPRTRLSIGRRHYPGSGTSPLNFSKPGYFRAASISTITAPLIGDKGASCEPCVIMVAVLCQVDLRAL